MVRAIAQFVLVGLAALVVGFSANALRGSTSLNVTKNYFDTGAGLVPVGTQASALTTDAKSIGAGIGPHGASNSASESVGTANDIVAARADDGTSSGGGHLEHPYQTITFDAVAALVDDPLTSAGLNVFVDARNEQAFAEGHIPGSMLCNPYQVANYLDRDVDGQTFLDRVLAAEKVVVYCGGGDCADSMFMSRELLELDVPYSSIFLYEGGWKDWTTNGGRSEEGAE